VCVCVCVCVCVGGGAVLNRLMIMCSVCRATAYDGICSKITENIVFIYGRRVRSNDD
jgi:hypothetical protein